MVDEKDTGLIDNKDNKIIVGDKKDKSTLTSFRSKEADKYELGMAKNNASVIISQTTKLNTLNHEQIAAQVNYLARHLYTRGRELRQEILGY